MKDTSPNTHTEMAQTYLQPSAASKAIQDDECMRQFGAILAQIKIAGIASLASSVRRNMQAQNSKEQTEPYESIDNTVTGCKVLPEPLRGSYNLAYCVLFDDGVKWILKVPANGSYARFDRLAADALTSEALTMQMIKRSTKIPVPTVYSFDVSLDNDVGCPYILMEFLQGKPLYEGWFDLEVSGAKREQFRARALQTVAAAMVQLNVFTLNRGGALRFDSAGQPVDVAGAKKPDAKTFYDCVDEGFYPEHDVWCENGPTTDPSSYLLFTLNRRGYEKGDSAYTRGVLESARLFTQWILELSDDMGRKGHRFVLAHPDFDFQNILVNDDGTLSGILDWDGVAAVPLSVGCLRYPNWLIRDWDPVNYSWNDEAQEPKSYSGRPENTPGELVCYRAMYAQFIEMLLPIDPMNNKAGKTGADITRMSLITGNLEVAVDRPVDTDQMIGQLFRGIERFVGEGNDTELSHTAASASNVGSDLSDTEHSATDTLVSSNEIGGKNSDDKSKRTGIEESTGELSSSAKGTNSESLFHECIANLHQLREAAEQAKTGTDLSALDVTSPKLSECEQEVPLSNPVLAEKAAREHKAHEPRKAGVAESTRNLSSKDSQGIAEVLSKKESIELDSRQRFRAVKWALGLGVKGCKEASKVFYKKEDAFSPGPKDRTATTSPQDDSQSESKIAMSAIRLCNRIETLLRNISTRLHRDSAPGTEGPNPKETDTKWFQVFYKWIIGILKIMLYKPVKTDVEGAEIPTTAEEGSPQRTVPVDTGCCQKYNSGEENLGRKKTSDGGNLTETKSDDIWACIAAEIDEGGIPIHMVKEHHDVIAQSVIRNLGQKIDRKKEKLLHLNNRKAARKLKKARKQTRLTNANDGNNQAPFQRPNPVKSTLAEQSLETRATGMDSAQMESSEGWVADLADREANTVHQIVVISPTGVESIVSGEAKKPGSAKRQHGNVANPGSSISGITSDAIGSNPIRLCNNDYRVSETESLISKLEAAKKRFDVETALKEQSSEPTSLIYKGADTGSVQLEYIKQQTPTNDTATSEATEEANQTLMTILLSLQNPEAVDANLQPNVSRVAEDSIGLPESNEGSQRPSSLIVSAVSQNARAVQTKAALKGGRWFETPRGSLKPIETKEIVDDSLNNQESISRPSNSFSDSEGVTSEPVLASREHKKVAKVSRFQRLFPNASKSAEVKVLQVPDMKEGLENDEEESSLNNKDEMGEVHNEGFSLVSSAQGFSNAKPVMKVSPDRATLESPSSEKTVVLGNFNMSEVCVALGNGNLDEKRMKQLEGGFKMMLAEALGRL